MSVTISLSYNGHDTKKGDRRFEVDNTDGVVYGSLYIRKGEDPELDAETQLFITVGTAKDFGSPPVPTTPIRKRATKA